MNDMITKRGFACVAAFSTDNKEVFFFDTLDEAVAFRDSFPVACTKIIYSATQYSNRHGWPNTFVEIGTFIRDSRGFLL